MFFEFLRPVFVGEGAILDANARNGAVTTLACNGGADA
jgi:hypothetical protein